MQKITALKVVAGLLFINSYAFSQPINNLFGDVVVPPPNVSSLGKYSDIPVDMSTGVAAIQVPIYTLRQGPLSLPIALTYNTSGIRVAESSSWVGAGWTLMTGGIVSRTVLGMPDEFNTGFYYTGSNLNVSPGTQVPETTCNNIANNLADGEPDQFSFNIPGYSGHFYIDYLHQPVLVPHQDLVVKYNGNNQLNSVLPQTERFQSFTITAPDGTIYHFGNAPNDTGDGLEYVAETSFGDNKYASTWYLMRIESADGLHKIDYYYENETYTYAYSGQMSETKYWVADVPINNPSASGSTPYHIYTYAKRLKAIQTTLEKVTFEGLINREDVGGSGKQLNKITIETFSAPIWCKRFDLTYDYFKDQPTPSYYFQKRLRLLSVQEMTCDGNLTLPKYEFQYEGDMLPSTMSLEYDHWGYYNGMGNGFPPTTLGGPSPLPVYTYGSGSRETDEALMKKGSLKKITYPTGGFTEFTYEANDYKKTITPVPSTILAISGPACRNYDISSNVVSFTSADINTLQYTIIHTPPSSCTNGALTNTFTLQLFQQGNSTPINAYQFNSSVPVTQNGSLVTLFPQVQPNTNYFFKLIASRAAQSFTIIDPGDDYVNQKVGGLRIKQTRTNDGVSSQNDIVADYSYLGVDGASSGKLFKEPEYGKVTSYPIIVNTDCNPEGWPKVGYVYYWHSAPVIPISSFEGRHVTYGRVIKLQGTSGSTISTFVTSDNSPQPGTAFPSIPETVSLKIAKPLQNDINSSDNTILLTENFEYNNTSYLPGNDYFLRVLPFTFVGSGCTNYTVYATSIFSTYSGYSLLTQHKVVADHVETKTDYFYYPDPVTYSLSPITEKFTDSDGKVVTTESQYNFTYPDATIKQFLLTRNIISKPWNIINKVSNVTVDGTIIEFAFYNLSSGIYQTTSTGGFARLYKSSRYETTWDANGTLIWNTSDLVGTVNSYDTKGFPQQFTKQNWQPEYYEWEAAGMLKKKTYLGFVWEYTYHPGTRLLSSIKDIDGQQTWYDYDNFGRLSKIWTKPTTIGVKTSANVTTSFLYKYKDVSTPKNYIQTTSIFTPVSGSGLSQQDIFEYFDGLGRSLQKVGKSQSPSLKDVVTDATEYDNVGRITKIYVPYECTTNTGAFTVAPSGTFAEQWAYEPSPLNRVAKVTPPDWYPTITYYDRNLGSDHVLQPGTSTEYPPNLLYKTTTIEPDPNCSKSGTPNGNKTIVFKDNKGRVVLIRKTDPSEAQKIDTYYKYDDKGRVTLILPPGTTASSSDLVYKFTYDGADNLLTKKVPDASLVTMKYNSRDQLVLQQDGNLLSQNKWQCIRYDDYGRPIKTGLFSGSIPNPIPLTLDPSDLYIENTYDGVLSIEKGKIKKERVRVFDASNTWLEKNYTYDNYGRVSNISGNNYLMPADLSSEALSFTYDFIGNMLQETRITKQTAAVTHTIVQKHDFDAWSRNVTNRHKLDAGAEVTVSALTYNWKNEVIEKNLGKVTVGGVTSYLQSLDYYYNPSGWLTTINSASLGGSNTSLQNCTVSPNPGNVNFSDPLDSKDLFYLELKYDQLQTILGGVAQKNGNVAQVLWRTRGRERQTYTMGYDYLNRLSTSTFKGLNDAGTATNNLNAWNENLSYDSRGNITTLARTGKYKPAGQTCWSDGTIDNLSYVYFSGFNRLQKISDAAPSSSKSYGWNNATGAASTAQYLYDANGNLTSDPYKGVSISYNFLNLPRQMVWSASNGSEQIIDLVYDASGRKLRKSVTDNGVLIYRQEYLGNLEYRYASATGLQPDAVYFTDGRVYNNSGAWRYEYNIKDHLGNIRLTFTDKNANGVIDVNNTSANEILQENNYYPFGMDQSGAWMNDLAADNYYKMNGKEATVDFSINWYDYGARWYDATLGRFSGVDPLAEEFSFINPYNYADNEPIANIDLWGTQQLTIHDNAVLQYAQGFIEGYTNKVSDIADAVIDPVEAITDLVQAFKDDPAGVMKEVLFPVNRYLDGSLESGQALLDGDFKKAGEINGSMTASLGVDALAIAIPLKEVTVVGELATVESRAATTLESGVSVTEGAAAKTSTTVLEGAVKSNYGRFVSKIPANSKSSASFQLLDDGNYLFQATSPGKVPGSSALYQKWVNPQGETFKMIKTTFAPDGSIIHVKPKF